MAVATVPGLAMAIGLWRASDRKSIRWGDQARAARLIAEASGDLVHRAEYEMLRGWLDRLPDGLVRSDPLLSSRYAWTLVLSGHTDGVEARLADVEGAMRTVVHAAAMVERVPAHFELIRSIAARMGGDLPAAIAHVERALVLAPPDPSLMNDALVADAHAILGHARLEAGDLDGAVEAYRTARPVEERAAAASHSSRPSIRTSYVANARPTPVGRAIVMSRDIGDTCDQPVA